MLKKAHGALVTHRHPGADIGTTLFLETVMGRVPQRHTGALPPIGRQDVQRPDLAHGRGRALVARAVKADKANDLIAFANHLHLRLAVLDGFAPQGLTFFDRGRSKLLVGQQPLVGSLGRGHVNLSDGFGIANGSGSYLVTGHGKVGLKRVTCADQVF